MRAIGIVVVIALIVFVIGLFAGWFSLTKETVAGETRIGVGIHRDEVERDAEHTKEAVKDLGHRIGDALDGKDAEHPVTPATAIEGVVSAVDAGARQFTVRTEAGELKPVPVADSAVVQLDGRPASLLDLKAGDRVAVVMVASEGELRATRVEAHRTG